MWSAAHAGEHPKTIQTLLRHSSITLIRDTYGHLFPGQAEAAVNKLHAIMVGPSISLPATGTEAASAVTPEFAQRLAQPAGDETLPERASRCDASGPTRAQTKPPKLRTWAVSCSLVRHRAQAAEERLEQPREPCGLEVVSETPGGNVRILSCGTRLPSCPAVFSRLSRAATSKLPGSSWSTR